MIFRYLDHQGYLQILRCTIQRHPVSRSYPGRCPPLLLGTEAFPNEVSDSLP